MMKHNDEWYRDENRWWYYDDDIMVKVNDIMVGTKRITIYKSTYITSNNIMMIIL